MFNATRGRSAFRADEYTGGTRRKEEVQLGLGTPLHRAARALNPGRTADAAEVNAALPPMRQRDLAGDLSPATGTVRPVAQQDGGAHSSLRSSNFPTHTDGDDAAAMLVQRALEQEKARISRELHDEVVQLLFAMKIDCAWLRQNLARDPERAMEKLDTLQQLLEGSAASVRRIAAGLRPQVLDEAGLVPAVQGLARDFIERTGTPCEVDAPADLQLDDPYGSTVFRIVQEALCNVRKHACASHVKVRIAVRRGVLNASVEDDGQGFRVNEARRSDAMGLCGLRERARLVGGDVTLSSVPGTGTVVSLRIPLQVARAQRSAALIALHGEQHALQ